MTMHHTTHPDDERLAAFAGADPEAAGDRALSAHVEECDQCRDVVDEVRALRTALANLPDLVPNRPLRLLPPVPEPQPGFAGRAAGFIRRAFAPALTAGAALALVGAVGTVGTGFPGMAMSPAGATAPAVERGAPGAATPSTAPEAAYGFSAADDLSYPSTESEAKPATQSLRDSAAVVLEPDGPAAPQATADEGMDGQDDLDGAENLSGGSDSGQGDSPWPIVLVAGIGLIAVTLVARFAMVQRSP